MLVIFHRGLNRYQAQRSISRAIYHRYSLSFSLSLDYCSLFLPRLCATRVATSRKRCEGTISVGMPGVECSRKMIHASRYQGTTIDHDVPITSCVSRVPRVRRSATGSTPAMGTRNGTRCFPGTRSCSSSPSSPSFSFLSRFLSPSLFFARQFLLRFFFSDEVFCGSHDAATSTCRETKHRKSKTLCNFRARRLKL